jgi:ribosomal protein L22
MGLMQMSNEAKHAAKLSKARPKCRTAEKAENDAKGTVIKRANQWEKTTVDDPAVAPVKRDSRTGQDHKPSRAGKYKKDDTAETNNEKRDEPSISF